MKKVIALVLVLTLSMALAACSLFPSNESSTPKKTFTLPVETTDPAVAALNAWLKNNRDSLLSSMEESFATSSGMTCTSNIEVIGSGFVITLNINELDNIPQETKDQMQAIYDSMGESFDSMLAQMQLELSQITYFTIIVGDKNGDVLSTITAGEQ